MTKKCQQHELYAAQRACPDGRDFATVGEVQEYLDSIFLVDPYLAARHPGVCRVEVAETVDRTAAGVGGFDRERNVGRADFRLPTTQRTVLHEVAHVLAERKFGSKSHDPYFCRTFLELVFTFMGSDPYLALLRGMEEQGVVHEPEHRD